MPIFTGGSIEINQEFESEMMWFFYGTRCSFEYIAISPALMGRGSVHAAAVSQVVSGFQLIQVR